MNKDEIKNVSKLNGLQEIIFKHLISIKDENNFVKINWTNFAKNFKINNLSVKTSVLRLKKKGFLENHIVTGGQNTLSIYKIKNIDSYYYQKGKENQLSQTNINNDVNTNESQGFIYVIQETGTHFIKIGWTKNQDDKRKLSLQTGNPRTFKTLFFIKGSIKTEKYLHSKFKNHHIRGEWFEFNEEINLFFNNRDILDLIQNIG